jgi:hypothetical protein
MKITNKVKIGGITYKVKNDSEMRKIENLLVEIDYNAEIIRLDTGLSNESDTKKMVFLHEIIHGILEQYGLDNEEKFVKSFSNGLYDVIKNNPKIFQENP